MAKPKFVATKQQLESAWKWKKRGYVVADICKKIKITIKVYEGNRIQFNRYFTQRRKEEANFDVIKKNTGPIALRVLPRQREADTRTSNNKQTKLDPTTINLEELEGFVLCGFNRDKIAQLFGITRKTLYTYAEEFPAIKDIMDNARMRKGKQLIESLYGMTKDREVNDHYHASYLGKISTEKVKKFIPANLGAIKYIAANTINWSENPRPEQQHNKGTILKALDESMEDNNGN